MINCSIVKDKYRDSIGINPKYQKIIDTKLNDADSYNDFSLLVNIAIESFMSERAKKGDLGCWAHQCFYSYNKDGSISPYPTTTAKLSNFKTISGSRMMKYVRAGLMKSQKTRGRNNNRVNAYFLPYDFFTTNDLKIRFVPYQFGNFTA